MLQQFSWGHFLIAAIVLSIVWYGLVLLVFYRKELIGFLGAGGLVSVEGSSGVSEQRLADEVLNSSNAEFDASEGLMGASRLPDGVQLLSSSQVSFSALDVMRVDPDDRYEQVGLVADVVQELKGFFLALEQNAGDKRDFFVMMEKVKESYGRIGGHPSIGSINAFIRKYAPFHLSDKELENLWF